MHAWFRFSFINRLPAPLFRPWTNEVNILHYDSKAMGLCEDPHLFFDRHGHFHVFGHCYKCLNYPASDCGPAPNTPSGHGFSEDGVKWTWIGGADAPYFFTTPARGGGNFTVGTRERPSVFFDDSLAPAVLITAAAPPYPMDRSSKGVDWAFTFMVGVNG